jgi:thiol-disulfide isomerase/thioredoxin
MPTAAIAIRTNAARVNPHARPDAGETIERLLSRARSCAGDATRPSRRVWCGDECGAFYGAVLPLFGPIRVTDAETAQRRARDDAERRAMAAMCAVNMRACVDARATGARAMGRRARRVCVTMPRAMGGDGDDDGASDAVANAAGVAVGRRRALGAGVAVGFAALASGRANAATGGVIELTPENFTKEVEQSKNAVFVEFYAPWCPYCKRLEPIWEELPEKLSAAGSKTRVARMNVDTYTDYAKAYAVTGFPTLMLFENGRPVGAKTGLIDLPTAMKYAGVKDEGVLAQFAPAKQLEKILSGGEIQYINGELGEVRKELEGLSPDARARALGHLQAVESIVGVRSL